MLSVVGLLLLGFCLSAQGALYAPFTETFTPGSLAPEAGGSGRIDHYGFADNRDVSGQGSSIMSLGLILTFYDNTGLDYSGSGSSTMTGVLTLSHGVDELAHFDLTQLTATSNTGDPYYYSVWTSSDLSAFHSYDPNNTWSLVLTMPSESSSVNFLESWQLDITPVPEPVNVALGIFAGVFVVGGLCRTQQVRNLFRRSQVGVNQWLDAV
jgi:hypothetical protein